MGLRAWIRRSALALTLCVMLAACGSSGGAPVAELAASPGAALAVQDYELGPADRLRITVFGEEELTGEYVVSTNGGISFPLVGDVPAQGQTMLQFTENLRTALTRYVLRPNISVEVLNYRPFYILGEVESPGTYPYAAGLNVMNAVATAGGFSYRADNSRVFIKHGNELAERQYPLTSTTPVLPGDTVRIPERRF